MAQASGLCSAHRKLMLQKALCRAPPSRAHCFACLAPYRAFMRVLVTGSTGFIGSWVCKLLEQSGHTVLRGARVASASSIALDLSQTHAIASSLDAAAPDAIIHTAAIRDLSQCEREPALAHAVNVQSTIELAKWAGARGARLIFTSTDQVFDGRQGFYREGDRVNPINEYGRGKAAGEEAVLKHAFRTGTIARVALTLGHTRETNRSPNEFVVGALRAGKQATMYVQEFRSPILVQDCASALVELLAMPWLRILHVGGPERVNRLDMGIAIAQRYGLDASLCVPAFHDAKGSGLTRPLDTSMCPDLARQVLRLPPRDLREACAALS